MYIHTYNKYIYILCIQIYIYISHIMYIHTYNENEGEYPYVHTYIYVSHIIYTHTDNKYIHVLKSGGQPSKIICSP